MFRTAVDTWLNVGSRNGNIPVRCDLLNGRDTVSVDSLSRFVDKARSAGTNNHRCSVRRKRKEVGVAQKILYIPTNSDVAEIRASDISGIHPTLCLCERNL